MSGLLLYYKNVVRPLLILQYHYCTKEMIPEIRYIKVGIVFNNLASDDDWRIPMSLKLLRLITGQKAAINKLQW